MVEIGGRPIMWHIMQHYAHYGHSEFVVALGYKGEFIKRWFSEYSQLTQDLTVDLRKLEQHLRGSNHHQLFCIGIAKQING